jgi:hypothetical protein
MPPVLDTNIPLAVKQFQMDSPLDAQTKALTLRNLATTGQIQQASLQEHQRKIAEQAALAEVYKGSVGPDGTPDHQTIMEGMAARGLGHLIPEYRKNMLAGKKEQADIDTKGFELGKKRLDAANATISSLLQAPQVSHNDVITAMSGLVSQGLMDSSLGARFVRSMPGDPAQLRGWLTQRGLEAMDASKRMEMLTPNFQQIDQGGVIQTGTVDPLTGRYTQVGQIAKTNSPGELLTASTQRRGQDMTQSTTQRGQDMTARSAATVVQETPTGVVVVDKQGKTVTPLMEAGGVQLQSKTSPLTVNTNMKSRMADYIKEAKDLLPKATGSGIGHRVDTALGEVGASTAGGDASKQLELIGGWMQLNVPRFEGPQSDRDTGTYKTMAAQVGDPTVPISQRLKALETLESLQKTIPDLNSTRRTPEGKPRPPLSAFGGK